MKKISKEEIAEQLIAIAKMILGPPEEVEEKVIEASQKKAGRFPLKALDVNKLPNKDAFWALSIDEANRKFGLRLRPKDIGDVIFFLNMVGMGWERLQ